VRFKVEYHAEAWSMEYSNGSEMVGPFRPEDTVRLVGSQSFTNGRVLQVVDRGGLPWYEVWWRGRSDRPLFYSEGKLRRVSVREGDTIECGSWDSVDDWLEGALPGRYTLTEEGVPSHPNRVEVVIPEAAP
jgi:hypothetical protein